MRNVATKFYLAVILTIFVCVRGKQHLRMKLFTPGPAVTSITVKNALPDDVGLEEKYFKDIVNYVTSTLLDIAGLNRDRYVTVPMQGSGTYSVEAVIRTATPNRGKVLILSNGFFGGRLRTICKFAGISYHFISWEEGVRMDLNKIENHLKRNRRYSTVAMVHFETSTTVLNPVKEVGGLVKRYNPKAAFVVDAIGSYGCFPFDFEKAEVDFLVMMQHRCLQTFLGYAFVIARKDRLVRSKDNCRSFVLNVYDQWQSFETSGHFRFTTPAQLIVATKQGMVEYLEEGMDNRVERYSKNRDVLRNGLTDIGFVPFIPAEYGTSIVTAFYWPNHEFNFTEFQTRLEDRGTFIYPTSLTKIDLFRIGHIGNISVVDCEEFLSTVKSVLTSMNVPVPFPRGPYKTIS